MTNHKQIDAIIASEAKSLRECGCNINQSFADALAALIKSANADELAMLLAVAYTAAPHENDLGEEIDVWFDLNEPIDAYSAAYCAQFDDDDHPCQVAAREYERSKEIDYRFAIGAP